MNEEKPKMKNKLCIIKGNFNLYQKLYKRMFVDLNLSGNEIVADARKHGTLISDATISRYVNMFDDKKRKMKQGTEGTLSQENILWLCKRYGIEVNIEIKLLPVNECPYYVDNLKE